MATGVDIDKYLFNSLHRLIALIEPGAGSNFERPRKAVTRKVVNWLARQVAEFSQKPSLFPGAIATP
jgi:hypothetical protein